VAPIRNPVYVTMSDGSIRNTYDVRLRNMTNQPTSFRLFATGHPHLRMQLEGTPYETVDLAAQGSELQRVYVISPSGSDPALSERTELRFWVEDLSNGERNYADTTYFGTGD